MYALLLILIPLVGALLTALAGNRLAKFIAFAVSSLAFVVTLLLLAGFDPNGGLQQVWLVPWMPQLGLNFHIGVDGIGILPVLLTGLLVPVIILASANRHYARASAFYALILLMQSALFGVFMAQDVFLYYLFWEGALIPIYFIAAIWGGADRIRITFKFLLYTIFGSLFMLLAFVYLYLQTPLPHQAGVAALYAAPVSSAAQTWVFWALFVAFAIKMPVFPFHTWQPDTYTDAPAPATMLLSGIMLKMGVYSLYRWLLPLTPEATAQWGGVAMVLSVAGIIYGSVIALQQSDIKRLLAYSSFAHVGLMSAGILSLTLAGWQGGLIQMLAHGINVVGLFYVVDLIQQRTQTRQLKALGGLTREAPLLTVCFAVLMLGAVALPLTNGFVGEFLLLKGVFEYNMGIAAVAGITIILGAAYMLRFFQYSMLGEKQLQKPIQDLNTYELLTLLPLVALVLLMGIFPNLFLRLTEPAVQALLQVARG